MTNSITVRYHSNTIDGLSVFIKEDLSYVISGGEAEDHDLVTDPMLWDMAECLELSGWTKKLESEFIADILAGRV